MGKLGQPKVFVVVPVFQRLAHTLRCIADLEAQTYPNLEVVVVDGGSRDGSVDALRQLPAITVIADIGEQWWTGATWFGVEYALARGAADDFVMLLNNDTSFAPDMFDVLVSESHRLGAVVAPIARAGDGAVVNSGVSIDWKTYEIVQRHGDPNPPRSTWPVDALEGRATLVPLHMVRAVGNVARDQLPHHAADYEFSIRIHRHGFPILMTNCTSVTIDWDTEAIAAYWRPASFERLWWEATHRRSFTSMPVHFTLIDLAGPTGRRISLKASYLLRWLARALRRSPVRRLFAVRVLVRTLRMPNEPSSRSGPLGPGRAGVPLDGSSAARQQKPAQRRC